MPNSSPPVVLVCQPLLFGKSGSYLQILEGAGFEVRFPTPGGKALTEPQLLEQLGSVAATIASVEPYTETVLKNAASLRVIARMGVGYDSIDLAAATKHGVAVAITPGTNHEAVAEHTFALLLAAAKGIITGHADISQGGFRRQPSYALRGKVLGLVGLGRIGRAVARRAAAFDMQVLAHDPLLTSLPSDAAGVELVSLAELLARSDIISLHAAATEGTARLICQETLAQMKPGVVLINTSRGTLIDEAALCEALHAGKVAAAGLDVFEREPPAGSPILSAPRVVFSAHIAGVDEQAFEDMALMAAQTIVELSQGRWPAERIVNAGELQPAWNRARKTGAG